MFQIPEPLHPAMVHFPIVLLLIGAGGAVVSLFTERWYVRKWAAIALLLGALGAVAATWSGNNAKETVGVLAESAETLLDHHEELAETTRNIAIVAAVLGLVAAFANLRGMLLRVARVTTAVVSLVCVYYVVQTAHMGGQLVYKHGVGLSSSVQSPNPAAPGPPTGTAEKAMRIRTPIRNAPA